MSYSAHAGRLAARHRRSTIDVNGRYGGFLCFILCGYAVIGKGFAYLGIPPLFLGEIAIVLGLLVVVRSRCAVAMFATLPSVLLFALICLVLLRTIPYLGTHGVMALRDSVVVVYGVFAFIVAALLLERPERLSRLLSLYGRFAVFYGYAGLVVLNSAAVLGSAMPNWPGQIPLIYVRLGEGSAHLAGAAVFAILGLRRVSVLWVLFTLIGIGASSVSRGAMLTSLVPIAIVAILGRERRRFGLVLAVAGTLFAVTYAAGLNIPLEGGRSVGPEQIVNGIGSIIGTSEEANLDGTKTWRLNWWRSIVEQTVYGPYFWVGKGFGVNLAEEAGYVEGREGAGPPVRSPHNVNMTMLARTGVPGLLLWIVTVASWLGMLFRMMFIARQRGDLRWADIFLWNACYGTAIIIDACFDVALEGPMLGIWFWCLFGLGIANTIIYRAVLRDNRPAAWQP